MALCSSIPAWKIPWTEEPGRLQSMGSQKSQAWLTKHTHTHTHVCVCILFFRLFSLIGYYKIFPVLHRKSSSFIYCIHSSVYLLMPNPFPFGNHKFVFYCLWVYFHLVCKFICTIFPLPFRTPHDRGMSRSQAMSPTCYVIFEVVHLLLPIFPALRIRAHSRKFCPRRWALMETNGLALILIFLSI